jgi:hypothetical protein
MAAIALKVYEKDKRIFEHYKTLSVEERLALKVADVPFASRIHNSLRRAQIETLGDLVQRTHAKLIVLKGMGRTSVKQIDLYLGMLDLSLKGTTPAFVMAETEEELAEEPAATEEEWVVIEESSDRSEADLDARYAELESREQELESREQRVDELLTELQALLGRVEGVLS